MDELLKNLTSDESEFFEAWAQAVEEKKNTKTQTN